MGRPANARHLAWIRSLPCSVPGCRTFQPIHPHHVRSGGSAGMALKPNDREAVPLCAFHHIEVGHRGGWQTFEAKYEIDLAALAKALAVLSPWLEGTALKRRQADEFSGH